MCSNLSSCGERGTDKNSSAASMPHLCRQLRAQGNCIDRDACRHRAGEKIRLQYALKRSDGAGQDCAVSNGRQSSAQSSRVRDCLKSPWFYGVDPVNLGTSYASQ
jgi:hypothetical protein